MDDPKPLEDGARTGTLSRADLLKGAAAAGVGAGAMGALLTDRASAHSGKAISKGDARERGLYIHLTRILWITVNVSDLERSIDFYERTYPVTRAERTNGPAQSFRSLGIKQGEFEGRIMRDSQPFQGRALHLVQWKSPGPVGEPYKEANHVGFYRHHASATRSGLTDRYQNVLAQGGQPYGPPSFIFITPTSGTNASRSSTRTGRRWSGSARSSRTRPGCPTTSAPTTRTAAICGALTASIATRWGRPSRPG